jgi:hypothetical protein
MFKRFISWVTGALRTSDCGLEDDKPQEPTPLVKLLREMLEAGCNIEERLDRIEHNGVLDRLNAIEVRLDALDPHVAIVAFGPAKAPSHPKKEGRRPRKAPKTGR